VPIAVATLAVGAAAATLGTDLFVGGFGLDPLLTPVGTRASLAISAVSAFVGLPVALLNLIRLVRNKPLLHFRVPEWTVAWLAAGTAFTFGVLIGTTIFR
jgi:hypothetical protein